MKKITCAAVISLLIIATGCEERPITYSGLEPPFHLKIDTLYNFTGHTYRTPPVMGEYAKLYLGAEQGYEAPQSLFKISRLTGTYLGTSLESLLDTTISIDSVHFILTAVGDSLSTDLPFGLFYFPNSGDSLFSENKTTYLDGILDVTASEKVPVSTTQMTIAEADSGVTVHPELIFSMTDSIFRTFADTAGSTPNRTLMVEAAPGLPHMETFFSSESGLDPRLTIFYRKAVNDTTEDTLRVSFYPIMDLSVMIPAEVVADDSVYWSMGRAKGLNSIVSFDISGIEFPRTTIIKSAKLHLFEPNQADTSFTILAYPLADSVANMEFDYTDSDPFKIITAYPMIGQLSNGQVTLEIREFLQQLTLNRRNNYGIKLLSSTGNNPLMVLRVAQPSGGATDPYLEVTYVVE